jgi:solute carrier family 35 protein C2
VKTRGDFLQLNLTDRNVVKRLCINASLILMWYFFSLSISIVSVFPPCR